jgi:hypothetical protein
MYLNDWEHGGKTQMLRDFGITEEDLDGFEVLLASYSYVDYEGYAFVLLKKDNQLFEVNCQHCSCFGLSGEWEVEESSKESLLRRLDLGGKNYYKEYEHQLRAVLSGIEI